MKKLEELSKEQIEMMPKVRDFWINKALNEKPVINEIKIKEFINWLYELTKLKSPKIIISGSLLRAQLLANKLKNTKNQLYPASWIGLNSIGWVSFYDFFEKAGIIKHELFSKYRDFLEQTCIWDILFFENLAIIVIKPVKINRNERGRLHSTTEEAVGWIDGEKQYFIDGINFDLRTWTKIKDKTMTGKEAINLKNIEQKTVAFRYLGYENILRELDAKVIDTYTPKNHPYERTYELIEMFLKDELTRINLSDTMAQNSNSARFIKIVCHSTGKEAVLRVPPTINNILDGIAWSFNLDKKNYNPIVET